MCGICGIYSQNGLIKDKYLKLIKPMISIIRHRGPDSWGIYADNHTVLGHCRLEIIDLASGQQPMSNETEDVWITFNGEIFNYIELRKILEKKGHKFKTKSDTEVILHLYEEHGKNCVSYLNGQFAFVIWDKLKHQLFMARDRFGIRPLFYTITHNPHFFLFASEIKAIMTYPKISREIDFKAITQVFTFWSILPPRTIFKHIYTLPPGSILTLNSHGEIHTEKYWDINFAPDYDKNHTNTANIDELAYQLRSYLLNATKLRLRADVPVGAYLSGGIDSSSVVSLIHNHFTNRMRTFSISFKDKDYDEKTYQEKMVKYLNTDHTNIEITQNDIGKYFPDTIWHTETPILRTAPVPLFLLSQLVKQSGFKVVLTGEGADECLAGYNIFKETRLRHFWAKNPKSTWRPTLFSKLYPYIAGRSEKTQAFWQKHFAKGLDKADIPYFSHLIRWQNISWAKNFLSSNVKSEAQTYNCIDEFCSTLPANFHKWDYLSKAQYIEIVTFMSTYLLSSQGDRVAMAHSIEGRFPFLDHTFFELCCTIPPKFRLRSLKEKYILRKAMKKFLPEEIIKREKKPYRAPEASSFFPEKNQGYPFVEELLSGSFIESAKIFNIKSTTKLLKKCRNSYGKNLTARENQIIIGILSTHLIYYFFIKAAGLRSIPPLEKGKIIKEIKGAILEYGCKG